MGPRRARDPSKSVKAATPPEKKPFFGLVRFVSWMILKG